MANLTITNTFTAATTAASAQVNTNYSDIKTWLNNRDNGTDFWLNMKVSGTASNPGEIKSSSTDCEFDVDCTGTNGTPRYSLRRSGTTYYTWGVDGASSNLFKFGTTALTTNVVFQVPTTGVQMQFPSGSSTTPPISFISGTNYGMYLNSGKLVLASNGSDALTISSAQQLQATSGSSSAPAYSFSSATSSGMYLTGANGVTVSANGTSGGYLVLLTNGDFLTSQVAPVATNATAGFFHLPTVAGTPTGTPTTYTGQKAVLFDTSANKLWIYNAGWKSVAVS